MFKFNQKATILRTCKPIKPIIFLNLDTRYKLLDNKLSLGLTGKNLLNTERFRNPPVSDIGTVTTEYRLLQRFVLLKWEYKF